MTSQSRRDRNADRLTDDELAIISGGPTEELFGNYNFLLEVAGAQANPVRKGLEPRHD